MKMLKGNYWDYKVELHIRARSLEEYASKLARMREIAEEVEYEEVGTA
jgi:hypothetical protein